MVASNTHQPPSDTVALGERIYAERLRAILEPAHNGECVAIDVDTGEYVVDRDPLAALDRAESMHPRGRFFLGRVGHDAFLRIGARSMSRPA